jgi:GDPmannose 4,6-dehydratase
MTTAIIVGAAGQDGQLLQASLKSKGYSVVGITRSQVLPPAPAIPQTFSIADYKQVCGLVESLQPAQIYYLAAHHHSSENRPVNNLDLLRKSFEIHAFYLANFLHAIKDVSPKSKLFYASSSLIFGMPTVDVQDENTSFSPRTNYGLSKLAGMYLCRQYVEAGIFAATGILYNHESHLRSDHFISKRILSAAMAACRGESATLRVGMLDACVDWGYAPDFVEAMQRILALGQPDEFVVATGVPHTVREFSALAFGSIGLDYGKFVREDASLLKDRPARLIGNSRKLTSLTGWRPSVSFEEMIHLLMTRAET